MDRQTMMVRFFIMGFFVSCSSLAAGGS